MSEIHLTTMPPGRPIVKLEINFKNPLESLNDIEKMFSYPAIRANVVLFATSILKIAGGNPSKGCQTDIDANSLMNVIYEQDTAENFIESVCNITQNMVNFEKSYLTSLLWKQMEEKDKVKLMLMFYCDLSIEGLIFFSWKCIK